MLNEDIEELYGVFSGLLIEDWDLLVVDRILKWIFVNADTRRKNSKFHFKINHLKGIVPKHINCPNITPSLEIFHFNKGCIHPFEM